MSGINSVNSSPIPPQSTVGISDVQSKNTTTQAEKLEMDNDADDVKTKPNTAQLNGQGSIIDKTV
ncbi:MAG: hypothetical protein WCJ01_11830 [Ignavibacteria bacterium]